MKKGKALEYEVSRGFKALAASSPSVFFRRWPDTATFKKIGQDAVAQKSPGDFLLVYASVPVMIECKETSQKSIPLSNIKPHQVESLASFEKAGGFAFIFISYRKSHGKAVTYCVRIGGFVKAAAESKKKSLRVWPVPGVFGENAAVVFTYKKNGSFPAAEFAMRLDKEVLGRECQLKNRINGWH